MINWMGQKLRRIILMNNTGTLESRVTSFSPHDLCIIIWKPTGHWVLPERGSRPSISELNWEVGLRRASVETGPSRPVYKTGLRRWGIFDKLLTKQLHPWLVF